MGGGDWTLSSVEFSRVFLQQAAYCGLLVLHAHLSISQQRRDISHAGKESFPWLLTVGEGPYYPFEVALSSPDVVRATPIQLGEGPTFCC